MDPLAIAGLAVSAVGLAVQLCETGDKAFDLTSILSKSSPTNDEITSVTLLTSHECEQSKLLKAVLFDKGKFGFSGSIFEKMDERNQSLMFAILYQLSEAWVEFHGTVQRLYARVIGSDVPSNHVDSVMFGVPLSRDRSMVEQKRMEGDLDRLKAVLSTTTAWNQRIERSVRTHLWLYSTDQNSPATNIANLQQVAADSSAQQLGWVETAKLRQIVVAVGTSPTNTPALMLPPSLKYPENSLNLVDRLSDGLISGLLGKLKVLVEFRSYTRTDTSVAIPLASLERRVEQLTALLHIAKDPSFRMPTALGFFHDPKKSRYGIIFNPQQDLRNSHKVHPFSLHNLFSKCRDANSHSGSPKRPSLGNRFGLAHALALALSKFQSIGWVHESIRSENIFFFNHTSTPIQIRYCEPWLFGYGNSRPDTSLSIDMYDENPIRNLYRHPDRWGLLPVASFRKVHDIYSLGVVLLEIAFWKPVADLVRTVSRNKGAVAEDVHRELLLLARHEDVADSMGEKFATIIVTCLTGSTTSFGVNEGQDTREDSLLQGAFQKYVVDVFAESLASLI